ncbi:hypothetical protein SBRCBS47491_004333 [Sporothrix bragantina]|uniref:Uncharacterized protein n=1 Tax=Sporothrix bragantina TaxID=671064 RepID=A0ABP0BN34_9PEZI
MIDPTTLEAACCSIGLTCGSPCNEKQYECNATTTKILTETQTDLVISGTATLSLTEPTSDVTTGAETIVTKVVTTITTTSTYSACCARRCQGTSQFACASSFGGGCCSFGQTCASNSQCIWTASEASTSPDTSATGLVSALPSGCTTSQIACPSSLGGGCCALGHTCTVVSSQIFCASAPGATISGITTTTDDGGSSNLSTGAKAGIALGAVVGGAALIGAAAWVCVRQRRARRGSTRRDSSLPPPSFGTHEYDDLQQQPRVDPQMHQPDMYPGVAGSVATSTPARSWRRPLNFRRNTASTGFGGMGAANSSSGAGGGGTPGVGGPTPSESEAMSRAGGVPGGGRLPGLAQDYFGPNAVPGPFTVPGYDTQAMGGNGNGGVPMQPHGPHDIVAPVEIDSTQRTLQPEMGVEAEKAAGAPFVQATPHTESLQPTPDGYQHYELYGSDVQSPQAQPVVSPSNEQPPNVGSMGVAPGEEAGEPVVSPMETANRHGAAPRQN